jgi:hypothetical protein
MSRNQREHTTDEKSVPAKTSLTRKRSKASPTKALDERVISARKKNYGSADPDFLMGLGKRIINPGMGRVVDGEELRYKLSVIRGAEPRNQFESMLALQMAAVHDAIMRSKRIFTHAENVMEHDSAGRMVHKLARTFLDQLNAWQRNRTAGDQQVTVPHASVSGCGLTIVGRVTQAPGANVADKLAAASPLTSSKPQTDPTGDRGGGRGTSQSRRVQAKNK